MSQHLEQDSVPASGAGREIRIPSGSPVDEPVTIEDQIDGVITEVETMKDSFQQQLAGLKTLTTKLKNIQREHKSSTKELHTVRQTLKGLQNVKF